jgi:hypothetical protein
MEEETGKDLIAQRSGRSESVKSGTLMDFQRTTFMGAKNGIIPS